MERESPRTGQGARAGKSIAADGHGHSKTSKAKPSQRKAGRQGWAVCDARQNNRNGRDRGLFSRRNGRSGLRA